jgi:hypothetical protein
MMNTELKMVDRILVLAREAAEQCAHAKALRLEAKDLRRVCYNSRTALQTLVLANRKATSLAQARAAGSPSGHAGCSTAILSVAPVSNPLHRSAARAGNWGAVRSCATSAGASHFGSTENSNHPSSLIVREPSTMALAMLNGSVPFVGAR